MTKTFYFINGMPRSGSTLLANILNQNPRFWATPTSGLCSLLLQTNHAWSGIPEIRASATPEAKIATLRGMFDGFHSGIEQPVIFSKSRGWVCAFELLENVLDHKPKMIVTYRDIPGILSSCEKLFRRELAQPESVAQWGANMETIEGRLAFWTASDQIVGGAYNRIRDCVRRGHRDSLCFVNFDDLVSAPEQAMHAIYEFLGEEYFLHDFDNVRQTTLEKDIEHGFCDLHTIRRQVRPVRKDYREILGEAAKLYAHINYEFIER